METIELADEPEKLFNLLSDLTRLRCLNLMYKKQEICVCELAYGLEISQPKISRHLALLRKSALVITRKTGLWVYYQINPELSPWIHQLLTNTFENIDMLSPYSNDFARIEDTEKLNQICNVAPNKA